jgi:regulator of ribonuclease activity A
VTIADFWNKYKDLLNCVDPIFNHFGKKKSSYGKTTTLKLFKDNSSVRKQLKSDATGKELVVDGGGSLHCVLLGDQLVTLTTEDKWNGIIINGCLRDTQLINSIEIDIRALNISPVKSIKHNSGETDSIVKLGGC